jgi:alpha-beta hydrolase superfamily lysophospholipase
MIEPFFFRSEQTIGFYHPSRDPNSVRLLVVCPPLFDEYRRSYRALSELAVACADQGVHVLRFDYFGTGESRGLLEQSRLSDWEEDIEAAIKEGIELSGAEEVYLLGVRFGATLAAQSTNLKIRRYIFWNPIMSGKVYLNWLSEVNAEIKQRHKAIALEGNLKLEDISYDNFLLSSDLQDDMAHISINPQDREKSARYFVISTNSSDRSLGFQHYEFAEMDYDWPGYHDGVLSQKSVLEAIVRRVVKP